MTGTPASDKLGLPWERSGTKSHQLGFVPLRPDKLHVYLDLVERCNLKCTHCAFVYWRDELLAGATMSDETLERLAEEVFPYCRRVSLSCFHEPLVAPNRLLRALAHCRRAGVQAVDMVTNGLLATEKVLEGLMAGGMSRIYFSVDGARAATYEAVRKGGTFEQFVEKVGLTVRTRARLGMEKDVVLSFIFVAMKSNVADAPRLVELAAELGVDIVELRFLSKSDVAEVSADETLWHAQEEADRSFDAAEERARELGVRLQGLPPRFRDQKVPPADRRYAVNCGFPWTTVVFTPGGDVIPCCLWHGNDPIDTIATRSFAEVWNGVALRALRRDLALGRLHTPACRDCLVQRPMGTPEFWETYPFRP